MNALDLVILSILAFFAVFSFFRGFVREAFSLGGVVLGVVGANTFYSSLGKVLSKSINTDEIAYTLAYVMIFLAVTIIMVILGRILSKFVKLVLLKWLDRLLGLAFGLSKGLIVAAILVMVISMVLPQKSTFVSNSRLTPIVESIYSFAPAGFLTKLKEKKKTAEKYLHKRSFQKEGSRGSEL